VTFTQRFSLFFFGLVGFFILTHYSLSNEEVGVYALFLTIINMMEYVKMGLLRNALIKFSHDPRFSNRLSQVRSASLLINVLFSAIIIILLLSGSNWLASLLKTPSLKSLLNWGCLLVLFSVPFNHCEIILQANLRFKKIFAAYFVRQGLLFFFIASTFFWQPNLLTVEHLVFAQVITLGLASGFILVTSRGLFQSRFYFDTEIVSDLLGFGKYVFGTATFSHIYKFADHFVTAYAIGDPVTGKIYVSYYSVVSRISGVLDLPFMAVADVLFPKNAQAMAKEGIGTVTHYFERMVGTLTALIIPASLFIFFIPSLVLKLVAGTAYLNAMPILQLTMLFAFLRPFSNQFGYTMDSIGKPRINFLVNFFFLLASLLTTYFFIRWFGGLMGAVYATTCTSIAGCFVFYLILKGHLNIRLKNILFYAIVTYRDLFLMIKKIRLQAS
jgi:O-antigen/teichoic acid export membrane protein